MNAKQIPSLTVSSRGLAVLMVGLLALVTFNARAEHYTVQEQLLVTGTQRPDPQHTDGLHFLRDRSAGVSTICGLVHESSTCAWTYVTSARAVRTIVITGQIVDTSANGDQIVYSFRGTLASSGHTESDLFTQVIKGTVTVTGGTGLFKNASGSGEMNCLVNSDGQFSSRSEVTLSIGGVSEK